MMNWPYLHLTEMLHIEEELKRAAYVTCRGAPPPEAPSKEPPQKEAGRKEASPQS